VHPPHNRKSEAGNPRPKVRAPVLDPPGGGPGEKVEHSNLARGLPCDKAVAIVLNGDIELLPDGKAKVASQSNCTTQYFVVMASAVARTFPKPQAIGANTVLRLGLLSGLIRWPRPSSKRIEPLRTATLNTRQLKCSPD
jgi:hypothetical protein